MSRDELGLTPKQRRLAMELAAGQRLEAACKRVGISLATAKRWKAKPAFQRYLDDLVADQQQALLSGLRSIALQALEALAEGLAAEDVRLRLKAGDMALTHLLRAAQYLELEARISELERRLDGR